MNQGREGMPDRVDHQASSQSTSPPMRLPLLCLLGLACQVAAAISTDPAVFFRPPAVDRSAGLPPEGIWPRGQRMLWAGYSGVAERDLKSGFSVAGPHYGGGNEVQLAACERLGLPVIAHIGPFPGNTSGSWDAVSKLP